MGCDELGKEDGTDELGKEEGWEGCDELGCDELGCDEGCVELGCDELGWDDDGNEEVGIDVRFKFSRLISVSANTYFWNSNIIIIKCKIVIMVKL